MSWLILPPQIPQKKILNLHIARRGLTQQVTHIIMYNKYCGFNEPLQR